LSLICGLNWLEIWITHVFQIDNSLAESVFLSIGVTVWTPRLCNVWVKHTLGACDALAYWMELKVVVLRLSDRVEWPVLFLNLNMLLALHTHSIAHQVINQSLAAVQICSEVVADLN